MLCMCVCVCVCVRARVCVCVSTHTTKRHTEREHFHPPVTVRFTNSPPHGIRAFQVFGYDVVIVLNDTQSQEKKDNLRWAGAHVVEVPAVPFADENNFIHVAARVAEVLKKARGGSGPTGTGTGDGECS